MGKDKESQNTNNEDSLLTPDEIKKLLDACQSPRDSSLIAILSESACRISEALNLNIGDLSKTDYGFKMRIRDGKTVQGYSSHKLVPHLTQWLNMHPLKNDTMLRYSQSWNKNHYERMAGHAVRKILRVLRKEQGLRKECIRICSGIPL